MSSDSPFWRNPDHIVDIDGVSIRFSDERPSKVGQLYVAERNTGPQLLTVSVIHPDGFVIPKEKFRYCYDLNECRLVVDIC